MDEDYKTPLLWIEKHMENILDWTALVLVGLAVICALGFVFSGFEVVWFFAALGCFFGAVSTIFSKMILVGITGKTASANTSTAEE